MSHEGGRACCGLVVCNSVPGHPIQDDTHSDVRISSLRLRPTDYATPLIAKLNSMYARCRVGNTASISTHCWACVRQDSRGAVAPELPPPVGISIGTVPPVLAPSIIALGHGSGHGSVFRKPPMTRGRRRDGMIQTVEHRLFVHNNNVMGSGPDGWRRNRTEAAKRLIARAAAAACAGRELRAARTGGRPLRHPRKPRTG